MKRLQDVKIAKRLIHSFSIMVAYCLIQTICSLLLPLPALVTVLISNIVWLLLTYSYARWAHIQVIQYHWLSLKQICYTAIISLVGIIIWEVCLYPFISTDTLNQQHVIESVSHTPLWISYLSIALIAPITEETLFRGVIYHSFNNPLLGGLISTILFAICHVPTSAAEFILYAGLGTIFCAWYWKTKNILTAIITHMICNTIFFIL